MAERAVVVVVVVVVAALLSSPCTSRARAEEGPYSNFMVGERALGLAGAAVAVADDPGAIFHNPGGLASLTTSSASGSLWTLVRGGRSVDRGYRTPLGATDLEDSAALSFPSFLAGVVKFGPKQPDDVHPHALAAAILSPHSDEYRFIAQLDEPPSALDRLEVRHQDNARWYGLAYAYRLRPGLSLGVSSFLASRSLRHDEVEINARRDPAQGSELASTATRASTLSLGTYHAVLRLGAYLDLTQTLRAGAMVQLPGLELHERVSFERADTLAGPVPTQISTERLRDQPVNLPMPWEVRFGVTWLHRPSSLMSLDLSLFGPAGDSEQPLPLVENADTRLGLFVPAAMYRRPALRGAIGFETEFDPRLPLRGGMFFEQSSAPEVLSQSAVYQRERLLRFGGSLAFGLRAGGYDISLGATFILGEGEASALVRGDDGTVRYRATDADETVLMVFVGGAKSAVNKLVRTLIRE